MKVFIDCVNNFIDELEMPTTVRGSVLIVYIPNEFKVQGFR